MPSCEPSGTDRPEPGLREVAGFRLLRRVGDGGMSRVYLSYDVAAGSPVAVKILADHLAHSREFVGRFYREARLSRLLAHPNLVRGLGAGYDQESAKHYLILEYIDGPTAHTALTRLGRFPVGVAVQIGLDIARALSFLHSRQYVHRDIKPDNILLHPDGVAKLADLGLAKRLNDDAQLTSASQGVGTSYYMAYEQALNANLVDGRSDIFALGATLYHLLTGQVPFLGTTHEEVIREKAQDTFRPIRELNAEVPPVLAEVIAATLARDPRARIQSAADLVTALESTHLATRIPAYAAADETAGQGSGPQSTTRADLCVQDRPSPIAPTGSIEPPGPAPTIEGFAPRAVRWPNPSPQSSPHEPMFPPRLMAGILAIVAIAALATGALLGARAVFVSPPGEAIPADMVLEVADPPPLGSLPPAVPQ